MVIVDDASDYNKITDNSIYENDDIGIDLGDNGVTSNDSQGHRGPNNYMNYPIIEKANPGKVKGKADPGAYVEIYLSDNDPSGDGEGEKLVGSGYADSEGNFEISITGVNPGDYVTSTATDSSGNTLVKK